MGYAPVYEELCTSQEREEWADVLPACSSPHMRPGAEADIADDESVASDWEEYCDDVSEW